MGYRNCPGCNAQNRDTDEKCYNCEAELTPKKAAGPSGVVENPVEAGQEHEASSRRLQELLEESHAHRKANWKHGLRAGAAAGAFMGFFYASFYGFFGAMLGSVAGTGRGLDAELTGAAIGGALVFGWCFISQVLYTMVIGLICGVLDVLCYQRDSSKIGAWVGGIYGFFTYGIFPPYMLVVAIMWGSASGWLASFAEKSWFRKQYAEM